MFFFRHPKPVVDGRAVAVQMVQQKANPAVSRTVLIVEARESAPAPPSALTAPQPAPCPAAMTAAPASARDTPA